MLFKDVVCLLNKPEKILGLDKRELVLSCAQSNLHNEQRLVPLCLVKNTDFFQLLSSHAY